MPAKEKPESDAPKKLASVSDVDRAKAIAAAVLQTTGRSARVEMLGSAYRGSFGLRGPFRQPARLQFEIWPTDATKPSDELIHALREVAEQELADVIAEKLGKIAGEQYVAEISERRYGYGKARSSVARISLLLAREIVEG